MTGVHIFSPKSRGLRAFTLVEVLIALGIFSFVIVAIYSSWTAIVRATKTGLDAAASAQRGRIAIRAIEDALLTAQVYGENMRFYSFVTDTKDENIHYMSCVSKLPQSFPGGGFFNEGEVRRVSFEVQSGDDGTNNLVMTQIQPMVITNESIKPYAITLVRDCSLFYLEFWDAQKNIWAAEWLATNQLPKMMRVTVGWGTVKGSSEPAEIVTRRVALPGSIVPTEIHKPQ